MSNHGKRNKREFSCSGIWDLFQLGTLVFKPSFVFSTIISMSSCWRQRLGGKMGIFYLCCFKKIPNFYVVQLCFTKGLCKWTVGLSFLVTVDQGYWAYLSFLFSASQIQFGLWVFGWTLSNSSLLTRIKELQAKFCSRSTCAFHMLE